MEVVQIITGLDEKMRQWRKGLLSDGEIIAWLIAAMNEVQFSMTVNEELIAERRFAKLGV